MSLKPSENLLTKPLSEWPVFYKDGLPFIYDDDHLFYDEEGNRLGEHSRHSDLNHALPPVLEWLLDAQNCSITKELTFRASIRLAQAGIVSPGAVRRGYVEVTPDLAVLKGVAPPDTATYHIGSDQPPPSVVFEIGSPSTYQEDLTYKFLVYEQIIRAAEYIAYDPHQPRLWEGSRLKGWRLVNGRYEEMRSNEQGWRWSEELQSWLAENGQHLRLYDAQGNRRLNKAEFQTARADTEKTRADQANARAEEERLKAEQANIRVEQAGTLVEMEKARAEEASARAEMEKARAEEANARAEQANARAEVEKSKAAEEKVRADQLEARLLALEAQLRNLNSAGEE